MNSWCWGFCTLVHSVFMWKYAQNLFLSYMMCVLLPTTYSNHETLNFEKWAALRTMTFYILGRYSICSLRMLSLHNISLCLHLEVMHACCYNCIPCFLLNLKLLLTYGASVPWEYRWNAIITLSNSLGITIHIHVHIYACMYSRFQISHLGGLVAPAEFECPR